MIKSISSGWLLCFRRQPKRVKVTGVHESGNILMSFSSLAVWLTVKDGQSNHFFLGKAALAATPYTLTSPTHRRCFGFPRAYSSGRFCRGCRRRLRARHQRGTGQDAGFYAYAGNVKLKVEALATEMLLPPLSSRRLIMYSPTLVRSTCGCRR